MIYLLDTNVCIEYLRGKNAQIRSQFAATPVADIVCCTVVAGELFYGAAKSKHPIVERVKVEKLFSAFTVLPFDLRAAAFYSEARVELESRGLMIGHYDVMIAAVALANDLTLVTHNTREFSRIVGLNIVDWEIP